MCGAINHKHAALAQAGPFGRKGLPSGLILTSGAWLLAIVLGQYSSVACIHGFLACWARAFRRRGRSCDSARGMIGYQTHKCRWESASWRLAWQRRPGHSRFSSRSWGQSTPRPVCWVVATGRARHQNHRPAPRVIMRPAPNWAILPCSAVASAPCSSNSLSLSRAVVAAPPRLSRNWLCITNGEPGYTLSPLSLNWRCNPHNLATQALHFQ